MYSPIDLSIFPAEREKALKKIERFSMFELFIYRSNLWMHSNRVSWMTEEVLPLAQKYLDIDAEKARILSLIHDDAEIITGDIQAGHKAVMSKEELDIVGIKEEKAADILAQKYPKHIHGYCYRDLLAHAKKKDCPEAELVSYIDKVDGFCESMHEVLAGNLSATHAMMFYPVTLAQFPFKFPSLIPLLKSNKSPLLFARNNPPHLVIKKDFAFFNKYHTEKSIKQKSEFHFYDKWKELVIKRGGKEGLRWLIERKEK